MGIDDAMTRRFARSTREAYPRDWCESALGIDAPIVKPSLIVRVWQWIFNRRSNA